MRGSKSGWRDLHSPGARFRLVPIKNLRLEPTDWRYAFDLNADVAAALLDIDAATLWRYTRTGRRGRDGRHTPPPRVFWPHGNRPHSQAYYSLESLEDFAAVAWQKPRELIYELIPHWYAVKHGRNDLIAEHRIKAAPKPPVPELYAGLAPDEREAVERGFPRGSYADGDNVYSLSGVLLTPHTDDPETLKEAARVEIARLIQESS